MAQNSVSYTNTVVGLFNKSKLLLSDVSHITDVSVSLDQILIQLGEVAPDWRRLAESLEIEGIHDIAQYVRHNWRAKQANLVV